MRALTRTPRDPLRLCLFGLLAVALLLAWPIGHAAQASDARLERAQEQRSQAQERLDGVYQRLQAVQAQIDELTAELDALESAQQEHAEHADEANSALAQRVRESYIRGNTDPTLTLLVTGSAEAAQEQARLLGVLAVQSRSELETATAARTRTKAAAEEVGHKRDAIAERRAEVEALHAEAQQALAEAEVEEREVREEIAREERARRQRERRERAAATRASRSSGSQQAAVSPNGGIACPVGQPRSYSDTWGAPRSGGRRHKGTDIMAPRGTPIYAYENGTISRLTSSSLGGISLYMRGDSGNRYYYTHLQGYVSGLSAGRRVSVGEHVAFNGDTGNARGIPHLHFEVMPGGGGNVNPYPYVVRACG